MSKGAVIVAMDGKKEILLTDQNEFQFNIANLGFKKDLAAHNDPGKVEETQAEQIFVLIEEPSYGSFLYRVVETEEVGVKLCEEILAREWTPVGTQIFICKDLRCFRKSFSTSNQDQGQ